MGVLAAAGLTFVAGCAGTPEPDVAVSSTVPTTVPSTAAPAVDIAEATDSDTDPTNVPPTTLATTTVPATTTTTSVPTTVPATTTTNNSSNNNSNNNSNSSNSNSNNNTLDGADWVVVEVSDGDTVIVDGPQGEQRVRLVGINTPERGECYSEEATGVLAGLVDGRPVRLVRDQSDTDQYGRLLRFVEVLDDAGRVIDVGAVLVGSGHALSRRYSPDTSRNDRYDVLQDEAQGAGRGLWAPDACGDPSVFGAGEVRLGLEIQADAPGDDGLNPNGEWVRFTNEAPNPLDLSGWEIADESASHRYRFGRFVLASGASVTLYTGCGTDSATELFWCNEGSAVWNNSGDTVFVKDPNGNIVIAETYRD